MIDTEKTSAQNKISVKKIFFVVLLVLLGVLCIFCREYTLRRAMVGFEGVSFDGMYFEPCTDYVLTNTLDTSKLICKSKDGGWTIYSVKGYEKNLDYIYAHSLIDGHWYERTD